MSPPPITPGIPGTRLPEPWEKEVADIKRRLDRLESDGTTMRRELQSYSDDEEDSQVKIPSDAPPKVKAGLGALQGIPPNQRGVVVVLVALIVALTVGFLVMQGQRLF